jgi:UPF0716 protein FxsA
MLRLVAFVVIPLVDLALLIWMGSKIGLIWTLAIVIATGVIGATLVKRQGLAIWSQARQRIASGTLPTRELAHGAMVVAAGAFLLSPGILTDLAGVALLVPPIREWVRQRIIRHYTDGTGRAARVEVWR